jgi:hypothetical protein
LIFPVLRTGLVQRRLIGNVSQLEINYRGRSLAAHFDRAFSRVRVRAGDRVPDVVFKRGDKKVSLFRLIGSFGLLALFGPGRNSHRMSAALDALHIRSFIVSTQSAGTLPDQYLEDLYADFARLYRAEGPFLYLIRPDGHVALFQRQAEAGALATYLKKIRAAAAVEKAFAL